jgi:hypothetical protein
MLCENALRLPMAAADDAILAQLHDYVLDPPVVEEAIRSALAELLPSDEERERRRTALRTEIQRLEDEQARLVDAIVTAGQVDALARALQEREQRKARLTQELAGIGEVRRNGERESAPRHTGISSA